MNQTRTLTRLRRRGGFTLTEILITLAVCSIALTGVLGLLALCIQRAAVSSRDLRGQLAAQRVVTDLLLPRAASATATEDTSARLLRADYPASPTFGPLLLPFSPSVSPIAVPSPSSFYTSNYESGYPGAWALLRLQGVSDPDRPGISKVTLTVESPGQSPAASRRKTTFNALVRIP